MMRGRWWGEAGAGWPVHAAVALLVVMALGAGVLVYALYAEPRWLEVTRPVLRVPGLPPALDGLTIAHLSDPHTGSEADAQILRSAVEATNALQPDLVVLTGDFAEEGEEARALLGREVRALQAPLGVYAVLGNHDVWLDPDAVTRTLEEAGVTVLRDSVAPLDVHGTRLWLVGLDDPGYSASNGHGRDMRYLSYRWAPQVQAYRRLEAEIPAGEPRILLVHNPDLNEFLSGEGGGEGETPRETLVALSGHTHGGQVRLPLYGPLYLPSAMGDKYAGGWAEAPGWPVYVNRGLGSNTLNIRLNCRPEVTLLTLRAGE